MGINTGQRHWASSRHTGRGKEGKEGMKPCCAAAQAVVCIWSGP